MDEPVTTARLAETAADRFVALRRSLGVTGFGLNQIVMEPGQRGRIHRHEAQEEVYVVLRGTLTLGFEEGERDFGEGEVVAVAPRVRRQIINRGPGPCSVIAVGGTPPHAGRDGIAFTDWEATEGRAPQEVPLPDDLPADQLRT